MIITKQDIENYLMVEIDPTFDTQLDVWISAVQKWIDSFIDRTLIMNETAQTRIFDAKKHESVIIDSCNDVEEVRISDELMSDEEYITFPYNSAIKWQIRRKSGYFPTGVGNISVKAKWGMFPENEIPDDIRLAATILVAHLLNSAKNPASGAEVKSETIGRYSVSYVTSEERSKILQAKDLLDPYKRLSL
jgi:hypothetical protein